MINIGSMEIEILLKLDPAQEQRCCRTKVEKVEKVNEVKKIVWNHDPQIFFRPRTLLINSRANLI